MGERTKQCRMSDAKDALGVCRSLSDSEPNEDPLRRGPQTPVSTQHERGTGALAARTRTCAAVPKRRQENLP